MKKLITNAKTIGLLDQLQDIVTASYAACGYDREFGTVNHSNLPDLAHYQSNGSFLVAKKYQVAPMEVAEKIASQLRGNPIFKQVSVARPGFINLLLSDDFIVSEVNAMIGPEAINLPKIPEPKKIIIDFGGANVAKPLHVGHLRSAIIGESLKRIGRFLGHEVIGDVHLGDWGLQIGMVITELKRLHPQWPYFAPGHSGAYPDSSPVSVADLETLYPEASQRAKADESVMADARQATVELQQGHPGYRALWKMIVTVSIADLKKDYSDLDVTFDLWLGESQANETANELIGQLMENGQAYESEGAIVMEVSSPNDVKPLPPLMLRNSNGALLYGATDLATIKQRVEANSPDEILYVVDKRQALHLEQVFRGANVAELIDSKTRLEHIEFGTMNGQDNKPFKTRSGGTMKLKDLIALIKDTAESRLRGIDADLEQGEFNRAEVIRKVGIATLKFADLSNYRAKDYIFDIERFSAFEGHTGPYLLYSVARANSILAKAQAKPILVGKATVPKADVERDLLLKLLEFPEALTASWDSKSPKLLCDFAFDLATIFNKFYHECPVLAEKDPDVSQSRLFLVEASRDILSVTLNLLGIETVERM